MGGKPGPGLLNYISNGMQCCLYSNLSTCLELCTHMVSFFSVDGWRLNDTYYSINELEKVVGVEPFLKLCCVHIDILCCIFFVFFVFVL